MNARFVQFFLTLILTTVCLSVTAGSYDTKIAAETSNNKIKEIAFVDAGIKNSDSLLREIDPNVDIVLIDSQRDGVEQIAETLATQKDIGAIHILSHGRPGILDLGATKLSAASMLSNHADEMAVIRGALSQNADILIYGCNFAQDTHGARAVELLAAATGADVVASDNLTGAVALGGDWDMEVQLGVIETAQISADGWDGILEAMSIGAVSAPVLSGGTGVNATGLWENAGTVGGTAIDVRATVISEAIPASANLTFARFGNDLIVRMYSIAEVTVRWEVLQAGTTIPVSGEPTFLVQDLDGAGGLPESVESVAAGLAGLVSYTVETPTNIVVTNINSTVRASGTLSQALGDKVGWISYSWTGVDSWEVTYESYVASQRDFIHDGNGSLSFDIPNVILADSTPPSVAISGAPVSTNATPFGITVTFSETVTGFVVGDISVGNGSAGTFVAVDGNTYTADITPDGNGDITIDIAAGVAQDAATNANTAAVQAVISFDNDADNDGIPDNIECPAGLPHTVPNCPDTDGDTIPDVLDTDSDDDGLLDGEEDANSNGVVDFGESNPLDSDSDNDGLLDGEEDANSNGVVDFGESDPLDSDSDDDGLTDGYEVNILASDPTSQTTVYTSPVNPGDMNGDGDINVGDLLLLQRQILGY